MANKDKKAKYFGLLVKRHQSYEEQLELAKGNVM